MFAIGLWLNGRLFPFELSQPLVALAALATRRQRPAVLDRAGSWASAQGVVTAASYEYGNTFLIVAGLLNMLVVLDAYDIALGRK